MLNNFPIINVLVWWICCGISASAFALHRAKDYRTVGPGEVVGSNKNGVNAEPTCEELKAMWRFSKRQSRAAEITNEIPMYRDPFSDNVWEPYYTPSRSLAGRRPLGKRPPIYGTVAYTLPDMRPPHRGSPAALTDKNKYEEVARGMWYGSLQRQDDPRRRLSAFRMQSHIPSSRSGSFQHLKKLIKTERARELQEQRLAEEDAARNAALKELSWNAAHRRTGPIGRNYRNLHYYDMDDSGSFMLEDRNNYMGGSRGGSGIISSYPDLFAAGPAHRQQQQQQQAFRPLTNFVGDSAKFTQDYSYPRGRSKSHSSTFFDTSSFNNAYNGYLL